MSVFTKISLSEAREICDSFAIDDITNITGITAGTQNSNYFITTPTAEYVLTIIEQLTPNHLDNLLAYIEFINNKIPCPKAKLTLDHNRFLMWQQKPIVITPKLNGSSRDTVNSPEEIKQVATLIATMHLSAMEYKQSLPNIRDQSWRQQMGQKITKYLNSSQKLLLNKALKIDNELPWEELPSAICHLDLFKDNLFFNNQELTGIIDFYYAGSAALIYDLAIAVNDWCIDDTGKILPTLYNTFINAYQKQRPLTPIEKKAWQKAAIVAALRFWLSRTWDKYHISHDIHTTIKDPSRYQHVLTTLLESSLPL